jgi:hypothetical protein
MVCGKRQGPERVFAFVSFEDKAISHKGIDKVRDLISFCNTCAIQHVSVRPCPRASPKLQFDNAYSRGGNPSRPVYEATLNLVTFKYFLRRRPT